MMTTDLTKSELYIHIPFCVKKCLYCDFLSFPADEKMKERYIEALCDELMYIGCERAEKPLRSVFIGGGTPSVLPAEQIVRVMETVKERFSLEEDAEVTIECNPGTLDEGKLKAYKECGINRLSLGLQSSHENELKSLGRIHTYEDFVSCIRMAEDAGFDNINVDLMSGLPGQTASSFEETLRKVCTLSDSIKHISAYSLIVEEETPFGQMFEDGQLNLPDEDEDREMYHMTSRILEEYGFARYEISNYARPGFECRHNIGYWTGEEYIGVGLGAASYISDRNYQLLYKNMPQKEIMVSGTDMLRLKNTEDIGKFIGYYSDKKNSDNCKDAGENSGIGIAAVEERLDLNSQMSEFCILGLRMCKGISKSEFAKRFGKDIYDRFGEVIRKHILSGLLEEDDDRIRCTPKGLDLNNSVLCDLLL